MTLKIVHMLRLISIIVSCVKHVAQLVKLVSPV